MKSIAGRCACTEVHLESAGRDLRHHADLPSSTSLPIFCFENATRVSRSSLLPFIMRDGSDLCIPPK
ncbi:hypothetical protein J4E82_006583 [Alternaria postmessia]|uniref:uncharacterized protein n=1 Tax=Alternaria postmessia TaxID=1187938 RepID=UPI0022254FE5|nr:uncharacterized protein J4E82_006583 [Alternaria postmessia]KAI5374715.1 hypothetical protein J4E82_006583 [Alternaria postmessia]